MLHLRVAPEYGAGPLWLAEDKGPPVEPESLPISADLVTALSDWDSSYQRTLNDDYPPWSGFTDQGEAQSWLDTGEVVVQRLRAELGPQGYAVETRLEGRSARSMVATDEPERPAESSVRQYE